MRESGMITIYVSPVLWMLLGWAVALFVAGVALSILIEWGRAIVVAIKRKREPTPPPPPTPTRAYDRYRGWHDATEKESKS